MDETRVPYALLAAFVAVADAASFSRAAVALGVSKGTVSRDIARLEAALGVELLHRTTHKVALSTAGAALHARVTPHLGALQDALRELPESRERPSGELRLTAPHDLGVTLLPELIAQFTARHPDVWINLRLANERLNLVTERIDLALRVAAGRLQDSSLVVRRLGGIASYHVASPTYVARRGEPSRFCDPAHDWLLLPIMLRHLPDRRTLRPRALADDLMALRQMAIEGMGVCLLPRFLATPNLLDGSLVRVLQREPIGPPLSLCAVYPSSGQVPRKVVAFRDFLVERLKARPLD